MVSFLWRQHLNRTSKKKKMTLISMIKYYCHTLFWYNSNILHTLKVNLTRKAHFSEVQENKFSFINSTIMKSFKTMDLSTIKSF